METNTARITEEAVDLPLCCEMMAGTPLNVLRSNKDHESQQGGGVKVGVERLAKFCPISVFLVLAHRSFHPSLHVCLFLEK